MNKKMSDVSLRGFASGERTRPVRIRGMCSLRGGGLTGWLGAFERSRSRNNICCPFARGGDDYGLFSK